ncbi:MAG: response regulator [Nostocaceae cyanobacterium]|nr:response regulator [Nostocaceae cyanobacterium]
MTLILKSIQSAEAFTPLILAVDDHEDNLVLLREVLTSFDCKTMTATTGENAIALAAKYIPNLILLDIMLPDCNGVEVVERLRINQETNNIPIVAVTALARAEDRDRLLLAGCDDYICKPYLLEDLEAIIRRYIPLTPSMA